jgi:hypothetical protein
VSLAGCTTGPSPGVTFSRSIITRNPDGTVTVQGSPEQVRSALVMTAKEIPFEGRTLSLLVRKTEHGKATFDITFPDQAVERVKVETGKSLDVLPDGQTLGIRIEVQDCH